MPADHAIEPAEAFQAALRQAERLVEAHPGGWLHSASNRPTGGILRLYQGAARRWRTLVQAILRRSPSASSTRSPIGRLPPDILRPATSGTRGSSCGRARTICNALARYEPGISPPRQIAAAVDLPGFDAVLKSEFAAVEGKSIDYAVMERHDDVAVMKHVLAWRSVGEAGGQFNAFAHRASADNRVDTAQCLTMMPAAPSSA